MDVPWNLPTSWSWQRFDQVARVASDLVDPAEYLDWPHIAPNHIESWTGRLLPFKTVEQDGVFSAKHRFAPGQLLYSKIRPYLAKVVLADFRGLCSADMYPIDTHLEPRFLKWWMLTNEFTRQAAGQQARTVLPKINTRSLAALTIPVPPVAEQRQIVDILEDHLSRLDAADAYVDRALTRSRGLIDSALVYDQAIRQAPRILLADLLNQPLRHGRSVPTAEGGGFPVLRLTAIRGGRIELTARKQGAWTATEAAQFLVRRGDFLVARGNGSLQLVGRGGLVVDDPDPVAYPDTAIKVRTRSDLINTSFFALIWDSREVRAQIERCARTTAGIYKINQADMRSVSIPTPDLNAQVDIVARSTALVEGRKRLVAAASAARVRGTSLRRSLLQAAFSGQLTGRPSEKDQIEELADA